MKTETEHQTENQAPLTGEAKQRDIALRQFRAYLHLAITARQCGRDTEFAALPGPKALTYCLALATVPEDVLAIEVSQPVRALLYQIEQVAAVCEGRLTGPDPAKAAAAQPVLDALDLALATILAELTWFVKRRAAVTTCQSLLEHVLYFWLFDDGGQMAESLRRHTQLHWADDREKDGSIAPGSLPEDFARDVFARVATLDRWVEAFPDHVRPAAESLPAWPLLAYRHTDRRALVRDLAEEDDELDPGSVQRETLINQRLSRVLTADFAVAARELLAGLTDPAERCQRLQEFLQTLKFQRREDYLTERLKIEMERRARERLDEQEHDDTVRENAPLLRQMMRGDIERLFATPDLTSQARGMAEAEAFLRSLKSEINPAGANGA